MSSELPARRFFFLLLTISTVLFALVVQPMATALFLAAVLAGVLWPVQQRLVRWLRGRRSLAAGTLTVGVILILVGPVVAFSAYVVTEATQGLRLVSRTIRSEGVTGIVHRLPAPLEKLAGQVIERLPQDKDGDNLDEVVQKQVSAQGGKAAVAVGAAVKATGSLLFQAVMMLIALYFLLVQGNELIAWLDGLSPLRPGQTRELLAEFKKVSYAVIVSTVITAGVQAGAALGGYLIARVPNPIFFAGVTFFVAFIPAIGAASVCLAAAFLLWATGHPYMALFLGVWGLVVVGLVDNIVKPLLIKGGMEMGGAVVFFALIGGIGAFGTVGLLLGPLIAALFLTLLRMYRRDFKPPSAGEPQVVLASSP
jgi:predicted PurR-regulated permease PerM